MAPAGDIHPCQHHLIDPRGNQLFDRINHRPTTNRPRRASAIGDDTKGASMITALLNLQKGSGVIIKLINKMARCLSDFHHIRHMNRRQHPLFKIAPIIGIKLVMIADNIIDLWQITPRGRINLRRTACHNNLGIRAFTPPFANRLTRLLFGLRRHRTSIEDNRIIQACLMRLITHDL